LDIRTNNQKYSIDNKKLLESAIAVTWFRVYSNKIQADPD